jgi:hypothetical protein
MKDERDEIKDLQEASSDKLLEQTCRKGREQSHWAAFQLPPAATFAYHNCIACISFCLGTVHTSTMSWLPDRSEKLAQSAVKVVDVVRRKLSTYTKTSRSFLTRL